MSDQPTQANRIETLAITVIFTVVTGCLLIGLPWQTRGGPDSSGWWTQPWLMPSIALCVLFLANAMSLLKDLLALRREPALLQEKDDAIAQMVGWFRPFEFFAYFLLYLGSLKYLGYFLSTALFIQLILFRVGLRTLQWRLRGLLAALALTAIFRWGLGIWVPTAELYDFFPGVARKFLTRWF